MITSAGRRVELMTCFRTAAADLGLNVSMLACDLEPAWSAACDAADAAFVLPPHGEPGYAEAVLALCAEYEVGLLVPTVDPELPPLAARAADFAAVGTELALGSSELVAMAYDKQRTADMLAARGIPVPRTAPAELALAAPRDWTWPLLVKPRFGSASNNVRILAGPEELETLGGLDGLVAQTVLRGEEYTINLFFDREGGLRCVVPHLRRQVRAGEVEKGVTCRHPALMEIGWQMAEALPRARGPLCFQAIVDADGGVGVFEINARFGGGYPLAHRAGAPFARWLLEEAAGLPGTAGDDWREGVVMLRYDAARFVEPGAG